ncbi:helix-turn-helix domain-containing protein [Acidovorax temperans]|uniref:helix-turn-helix domain-containing protein n=1 Tax=Acidovorax temperans TaxID=80878 RepID=UPI0006986D63|nr:helix-turn-helix domain-containing protein [Acidovorax temperans]
MSFDAISWAMNQPISRSSAKFLLVAMADCVNGEGIENMACFPSTAYLARRTAQDEKTVQANLQRLREMGFIEDTGERRGATGQVIVYKLKTPKNGGVTGGNFDVKDPQISGEAPPKTGALEIDETPPNFRGNTPKFPPKDPQISGETPPKTGDGTTKEPVMEPVMELKKRSKPHFDAQAIELPDWLPKETWAMWVQDRSARKKPVTEAGAKLQLRSLEKLRGQGHDPVRVVENAIEKGWQGLYAAKDGSTLAAQRSREGDIPACPIEVLLSAYAELLPTLPQYRPSLFKQSAGAELMRQRWAWVMTADYESGELLGQRLASSEAEGVTWFRRLFAYVAESPWLCGKRPRSDGKTWSADIVWLMELNNLQHVLSGKYHDGVGDGDA